MTMYFPCWEINRKRIAPVSGGTIVALDADQYALFVYFDVEGASDNTSTLSVKRALSEQKVMFAVRNWIFFSAVIKPRTVCDVKLVKHRHESSLSTRRCKGDPSRGQRHQSDEIRGEKI